MSETSIIEKLQAKINDPTTPADMVKMFQERLNMLKKTAASGISETTNLRTSKISGITFFGQQQSKMERDPGSKSPSKLSLRLVNITPSKEDGDGINFWEADTGFGKVLKFSELPAFIESNNNSEKVKQNLEGDVAFPVVNWVSSVVSLYHNRISPLFYIFLLTYLFIYML
jgi:hypothetical protein